MKKEMWKLMMGLAVVLLSISFGLTSCGDDDDEVGSEKELIGTWNIVHLDGYDKENGEVTKTYDENYEEGKETIVFNENHTVAGTWFDSGFQWAYKGNKLTLRWSDVDGDETEEMTVLEMSSTRMVAEVLEKVKESGVNYETYMKITCTRK